ncbi:MAG: class V aminotransferase [Rhodobacterales bacterium 65-51]|jgi:kynureninase|uniref:aminotransferase class V-fold PLP-dependent enzyme n=1 Tax=uncultured Gemmobacter sp. TaxID=1095917 RepID=UPI00095BFEDF|nr:aminotransferase class V-fold PLP-dependent enzyme [uncultured Gemmobacter sp.]OJY28421.1 MAG: class V aminotransferase [Rhodobacterales bacterium 65-51]
MQDSYFLYHSIGQYPGKAEDLARAMAEFAAVWAAPDDAQWGYLLGKRAGFIEHWRGIIGAPEGSLTTCENVTQGLHMLMTALPPERLSGKRVLVAADCFPSNHFLLTKLQDRLGFTLETVPMRQGAAWVEPEDFLAYWGPDVAVALLTWVASTTSHRIDLSAMVAHGRAMGSLIGVDITQGAGLLPFDVADPAVDFTISTSLKWMCGTPGAGILHVAPDLISQCQPELRGWFSQPDPFSWALDRFAYAPDIRRFDNGTPGCMAAIASLPALDWHAAQDRAALLAQNRRQTARIIAAADEMGLDLLTPRAETARGGSVMLRLPDSHPAPEIVVALRSAGIATDGRGQILRTSPGPVTTDDGVQALVTALRHLLRP